MNIPEFTTQNLYFTAPFQIDDFALLLGGNLDVINISSTRTLISSYFLIFTNIGVLLRTGYSGWKNNLNLI